MRGDSEAVSGSGAARPRAIPARLRVRRVVPLRRRQRRRRRLMVAAVASAGLAATLYAFAGGDPRGATDDCDFPMSPTPTPGTVVSVGDHRVVLDAGRCRFEVALAPASEGSDELAIGSRVLLRHAPGVLAGSRVLIAASSLGRDPLPGSEND